MTVRWGVLGAGMIADRAMLPAIAEATGAETVAIASRDPGRARALAERHGVGRVHGTYADLLADPEVDAVYVALANHAHAPQAIAALEAGKHVLCEKPLALTVAEVDAMAAAAESAGRLLVEASWYRWHPRTRLLERLLRDFEAAGRVTFVTAGFTFGGVPEGNYRLDPALGGGALYDVGCYTISAALWSFGTPPLAVSAKVEHGPTGVDLAATLEVTFEAGRAELRCGIAEEEAQWLSLFGSRGDFEVAPKPFTAWVGDDTELVWLPPGPREPEPIPAANAYALMVADVSAAIEGREEVDGRAPWLVPLADSRTTVAVIEAAFASAAAGAPVRMRRFTAASP